MNNCAFRRAWIAGRSFPANNGFKVACTLFMDDFARAGQKMVPVDARAGHLSPRGLRFFLWRALVTGRDADRKFVALRSQHRSARALHAAGRWGTMMWRVTRRVLGHFSGVGMPVWQVPGALAAGYTFYTLAAAAQFSQAVGATRDRVEILPAYVEHS